MLWIPELATNTVALTQQISEVVSVKQIQRLKQKYLLTSGTELSKTAFELLLYSNLLLTPSLSEPSIHMSMQRHLPIIPLHLTSAEWKWRSCTTEFELNCISTLGWSNDCQIYNSPVPCKDGSRRKAMSRDGCKKHERGTQSWRMYHSNNHTEK